MPKIVQMKSSSSKKEMPESSIIPQFACAIYLDKDGKQKTTFNISGGFPKDKVLGGLVEIAKQYKEGLLDHLVSDNSDKDMDELMELAGFE